MDHRLGVSALADLPIDAAFHRDVLGVNVFIDDDPGAQRRRGVEVLRVHEIRAEGNVVARRPIIGKRVAPNVWTESLGRDISASLANDQGRPQLRNPGIPYAPGTAPGHRRPMHIARPS